VLTLRRTGINPLVDIVSTPVQPGWIWLSLVAESGSAGVCPASTGLSAMSDEDGVLAANEAFYAAFRARDIAAMDGLWSRARSVAVFHPGWPGIEGREEVMDSWYRILVIGSPPSIRPLEPTVILNGSTAVVFCTEDLGDAAAIASNTFVREGGAWRLTHHQSAGLPARAPSGRTHRS
jgi:hypothetical protein